MRRRSARREIASNSFAADFLIRSLYFATSLQILNDVFEGEIGFFLSAFKCGDVLGILCQRFPDRIVDQLGHTAIRFRSLEPQSSVDMRIEVDSRAFLRRISHSGTIALQRYNVNARNDQVRRRHDRCSLEAISGTVAEVVGGWRNYGHCPQSSPLSLHLRS